MGPESFQQWQLGLGLLHYYYYYYHRPYF